jgi:hypothetical protein
VVVVAGSAYGPATGGGAGGELEASSLVGVEAGPSEGVVLASVDEVPAQHDQLAGGGDGGDLEPAPITDAPVEGA